MPKVNEPFQLAISHSPLALHVNLYALAGGAQIAHLEVETPGQSGVVRHPFPSGVPNEAVHLWIAKEENELGEGPAGARGGFATSISDVPPTIEIEQFP